MGDISVLLVDDNAEFLESAAQFLAREQGLRIVGQASSGPEAIDQVGVLRPDVVLMDVEMPGMSGLEATRRIKAAAAAPRVVIVSLHDSLEHRRAAEQAGADGYIGKGEFVSRVMGALTGQEDGGR
jgi:DNA-binding NarL/FixJ family response regulator